MEGNQTAARAAKRFLTDRVRTDWAWPNTPPPWSASEEEVRDASGFRARYYGTTSSSEAESEAEGNDKSSPYKFDSPDSVAAEVENRKETRKRRRRIRLEKEMEWNEGLSAFEKRRDAWTGVTAVKKYGTNTKSTRISESAAASDDVSMTTEDSEISKVEYQEPLAPIAGPLLPKNPIRDSITVKTYPEIYDKVVASARSPSVPINLADMTRALVQGWKDNGEWPPKAGPLDPLAGGRKKGTLVGVKTERGGAFTHHPHIHRGVESVKKLLHLNGHHEHGHEGANG